MLESKCYNHVSKADFSMGQKTSCLHHPLANAVQMLIPNSISPLTSTLSGYFSVALIAAYWKVQAHFSTSRSKPIKKKKKKKAQRTATVRERFMQSVSAEELIGDFFFNH